MIKKIRRFFKSEDGPTAVEYAVMLSLIGGAVLASVGVLANAMRDSYNSSGTAISSALST